jgi:hypothetical protein
MALTRDAVEERRNGSLNNRFGDDILTARVVANYGDPGRTENYYFDILSRFLIVMLEPVNRIPSYGISPIMFTIVKRPEHLWVDVDGGLQSNINNQRRSDQNGNINKGDSNNYTLDNIPEINRPYQLGEKIKIKKLESPINFHDTFFNSEYDAPNYLANAAKNKYNENYLTKDPVGAANVGNNPTKYASVKTFPLWDDAGNRDYKINGVTYSNGINEYHPSFSVVNNAGSPQAMTLPSFDSSKKYGIGLNKYTFEVFWRYISSNVSETDQIILGTAALYAKLTRQIGPYLWDVNTQGGALAASIGLFTSCAYEDMNLDAKFRGEANECLPLVVTNPSQFPVPRTKQVGSIKFDPTFEQIQNS